MKKITGIVEKSIFDDKKFMIIMIAETALPWLVAVFGNIASYYFSTGSTYWRLSSSGDEYLRKGYAEMYKRAESMCYIFYKCTMWFGGALIICFSVIGLAALVKHLKYRSVRENEVMYSKSRPLILFIWSTLCVLGTCVLMFMTLLFTYAQGV